MRYPLLLISLCAFIPLSLIAHSPSAAEITQLGSGDNAQIIIRVYHDISHSIRSYMRNPRKHYVQTIKLFSKVKGKGDKQSRKQRPFLIQQFEDQPTETYQEFTIPVTKFPELQNLKKGDRIVVRATCSVVGTLHEDVPVVFKAQA